MPFTYECAGCGKPVIAKARKKTLVFCDNKCRGQASVKHLDQSCPQCGKTFRPRGASRGRGIKYCSRECYAASLIAKECPVCGTEFLASAFMAGRYQVCSDACKAARTKDVTCERCGKQFQAQISSRQRYCSMECRRPANPMSITCRNCGRQFSAEPSRADRRFCSPSCFHSFSGETTLETRVRIALEQIGVAFTQQCAVGKWSIDFALTAHMIAIEADGDYWHSLTGTHDARRDAKLTRDGWRIIRLAENEVNKSRDLGKLILERVHETTGLELSDLEKQEGAANDPPSRRVFRARGRRSRRLGRAVRPAAGQGMLWD